MAVGCYDALRPMAMGHSEERSEELSEERSSESDGRACGAPPGGRPRRARNGANESEEPSTLTVDESEEPSTLTTAEGAAMMREFVQAEKDKDWTDRMARYFPEHERQEVAP